MIKSKLLTSTLVMVSIIFLYSVAVGQDVQQKTDIAEVSKSGDIVTWLVKAPNQGGTLTVSTPSGEVFETKFKSGSVPNFTPRNERGEYYGDGTYTYQIVLTPVISPSAREAMEQARIDGNSDRVAAELRKTNQLPAEPMVKSGSFAFAGGKLVVDNLQEDPTTSGSEPDKKIPANSKTSENTPGIRDKIPVNNDQVILDDLIVDGSICAGFDCVNGESFGFDTLRLKENNLRVKFQDTSTSASFPSNDWQLTANDSSNGGQNKFSIDDISGGRTPFTIEAGAPSHSLYVDDGGRIGLGTSTPVVEVHIKDGDTPTLRLEQDGTSGFTPQTWDVAGNETNFFVRDATNGSRLPFRIRPMAPSNSIFVDTDGDVGLGTSSPDVKLDVRGAGKFLSSETVGLEIANSSGGVNLQLDANDDNSFWNITAQTGGDFVINNNDGAGSTELTLQADGDLLIEGVLTQNNSDINRKTGFMGVNKNKVLNNLLNLDVNYWQYKGDKQKLRHIGPTAQDFQALFGVGRDLGILSVDMLGVTVTSIQAMHDKLEAQQKELEAQKQEAAKLKAEIEELKALVKSLINK